ncbi:MAG TPA: hypothetical protein VK626_01815 [Nitrospiraceae bacterium]|nr:hypothetical protein [Nitrospiraceae bacterium]
MTETLGQRQRRFLPLVAKLIDYAYSQGFELTAGELYRTPEQAALNAQHGSGITHSLHTQRLAVDLQLFKDGIYITDPAAYRPLGEFWKALDPDAAFGGDFKTVDADHFSLSWAGTK